MPAIFPEHTRGGATIGFPDTCKVPAPPRPTVPTPYPAGAGTLINVEPDGKHRAYKLEQGVVVDEHDARRLTDAATFAVAADGSLAATAERCTRPSAACDFSRRSFGPSSSATVVSLGDDGRVDAFRVTPRSYRRITADVNPPGLLDAIRRQPQAMLDIDGIVDAVRSALDVAVDAWRSEAGFRFGTVVGPIVSAGPGCLDGPPLEAAFSTAPVVDAMTGDARTIVLAVGRVVSAHFAAWQERVTLPGLPWYPLFGAWPGPFAPPMPNTPMPLVNCFSDAVGQLVSAGAVQTSLRAELGDILDPTYGPAQVEQLLLQIAIAISTSFCSWLTTQHVRLVMGTGPVPAYCPPYRIAGPVMGWIQPGPGHFLD